MAKALFEIAKWVSTLPYWQQVCFENVFDGKQISDEEYDQIVTYLLEDGGLLPKPDDRPKLEYLEKCKFSDETSNGKILRIKKLSKLKNINALAPNQELTFHPNLTIIFGNNGSGKSGYARVLGNASFTRGDKKVLPNFNSTDQKVLKQSAEIELEIDGETKIIEYQIDMGCPLLSSIYMFDTTSVHSHLSSENEMSFSPAGLEFLTKLAEVTDIVRNKLDDLIDQKNKENTFAKNLQGDSSVKTWLLDLDENSTLEELEHFSEFSDLHNKQIDELELSIAKLKSEDVTKEIAHINQKIEDYQKLIKELDRIEKLFSADKFQEINAQKKTRYSASMQLKTLNSENDETNSDEWIRFVKSAKQYLKDKKDYPKENDKCIFCNQQLTKEAVNHIAQLWIILENDSRRKFDQATDAIHSITDKFQRYNFDDFVNLNIALRHLEDDSPETSQEIKIFLEERKCLQKTIIEQIEDDDDLNINLTSKFSCQMIQEIINNLQNKVKELEAKQIEQEIEKLSKQKNILEHQKYLHNIKADVKMYIENLKWISNARSNPIRGNTGNITRKYGQLFNRLVTEEYLRIFEDILIKLKCPMEVKIGTRNKKGATYRQIELKPNRNNVKNLPTPDKVLSEGEQRAVALADFFTEVALDSNSMGVVLDDPITSLDFNWQETIAEYIISESTRQQVIVFTHDLHFMHVLASKANQIVEFDSHWIEKRNNIPGFVFLNNSPALESSYNNANIPEKWLREANDISLPPADVEARLKEGFGSLRTCYEYQIIYKLFGNVVQRFSERISVDRLKDVYIVPSTRDKIILKVGLLSRYIEGHLHSDQHNAQKPTPEDLRIEIEEYKEIVKEIRESKNK